MASIVIHCVSVEETTAESVLTFTMKQRGMVRALQPYFELTQAVRIGDVANFQKVVEANRECFARDDNTSLIQRYDMLHVSTFLLAVGHLFAFPCEDASFALLSNHYNNVVFLHRYGRISFIADCAETSLKLV